MKKAYIFAFIATLLWGSTASVIKLLLKDLNSIQILMFASFFASIGLFLIVIFQNKFSIIKNYKMKDYFRFACMGFIGVFLYYLFLYIALDYLKAQEAFIINYLWPIMIVLFAIPILGEKFNFRKIIAVILSFIGVVIIVTHGDLQQLSFDKPIGVIFAIIGAVCYGLFSVLGKKHNDDRTVSMMFYYVFSFFYSVIAIYLFSFFPSISGIQIVGLLWIGFFTSGGAFLLWFLALKNGDTTKISNIAFITPFVSLVYIYFLLDEKISVYSIIGLLFIIFGIFVQNIKINFKILILK
jgi:drug/metabolite transporter (DMT)-like permease